MGFRGGLASRNRVEVLVSEMMRRVPRRCDVVEKLLSFAKLGASGQKPIVAL